MALRRNRPWGRGLRVLFGQQSLDVRERVTGKGVGVDVAPIEADLHGQVSRVVDLPQRGDDRGEVAGAGARGKAATVGKVDVAEVLPHPVDVVARDLVPIQGVEGIDHYLDVLLPPLRHHLEGVVRALDQVAVGRGGLYDDSDATVCRCSCNLAESLTAPLPGLGPGGSKDLPAGDVDDCRAAEVGTEFHYFPVLANRLSSLRCRRRRGVEARSAARGRKHAGQRDSVVLERLLDGSPVFGVDVFWVRMGTR